MKSLTLKKILAVIGVMFVAFNLRPAITSVGPLIGSIRIDMEISYGSAGFLTTLPLLSFAIFSFLAPRLGQRFGYERMVFMGLVILLAGILVRLITETFMLFTGMALVGIGIAISNVLLPSIVKGKFPQRIGLMTAVYTTSMSVFSSIGTGLSIPLAQGFGLGWERTLACWGWLTLAAIVVWLPQLGLPAKVKRGDVQRAKSMWRSTIAWQVTVFMGLQSFLFYSMIAWLPEILNGRGLSIATAGWLVSIMQVTGIPMNFLTPIFADRFRNQRGIIGLIGCVYLLGLLGIWIADSIPALTVSVMLIGLGQGTSISLALTLLGLRTNDANESATLSGMAQSLGYSLAAIGPLGVGLLIDMTASVSGPLVVFMMVIVMMMFAGLGAGRDMKVFEQKAQMEK